MSSHILWGWLRKRVPCQYLWAPWWQEESLGKNLCKWKGLGRRGMRQLTQGLNTAGEAMPWILSFHLLYLRNAALVEMITKFIPSISTIFLCYCTGKSILKQFKKTSYVCRTFTFGLHNQPSQMGFGLWQPLKSFVSFWNFKVLGISKTTHMLLSEFRNRLVSE